MTHSTDPLDFPSIDCKVIQAGFDGGAISSDAGLLLVAQADRAIGLTQAMAKALPDCRQPGKLKHPILLLLQERIYGIVAGYEDANDLNRMRHDPALKLACGKTPAQPGLAAQSSFSRFENSLDARSLVDLGKAIAKLVIAQLSAGTKEVVLDIDATSDPCHGQQEFKGFNGYYDTHCYVPLYLFITGPDKRQRLLATLLRAGRSGNFTGACWLLRQAVDLIRERFAGVRILLRADAGFGTQKVMRFCEASDVDYVLGLRGNTNLHRLSQSAQLRAAAKYTAWCKHTVEACREFETFAYRSKSWPHERPVTVKAEVTQGELCPRFIASNMAATAEGLYTLYCQRGDIENRIKEVNLDLYAGRTSCCRFLANQTRLLLHTAASVLFCRLQEALGGSIHKAAQVGTIRAKLLKVAVRIVQSCRRVRLYLPSSYPWQREWTLMHRNLCRN